MRLFLLVGGWFGWLDGRVLLVIRRFLVRKHQTHFETERQSIDK
jgi:hypothetical protein